MEVRIISETKRSRRGNAEGAQVVVICRGQSVTRHVDTRTLNLLRLNSRRHNKGGE